MPLSPPKEPMSGANNDQREEVKVQRFDAKPPNKEQFIQIQNNFQTSDLLV